MTPRTHHTTERIEEYWRLGPAELERHIEFLSELARLKSKFQQPPGGLSPAPSRPQACTPVEPRASAPLPRRAPMRPPKPGSLRASVHAVLRRSTGAMRRSAVIAAVASARGSEPDEKLVTKVGDILNNPHDGSIRRVGHGVFTIEKEAR